MCTEYIFFYVSAVLLLVHYSKPQRNHSYSLSEQLRSTLCRLGCAHATQNPSQFIQVQLGIVPSLRMRMHCKKQLAFERPELMEAQQQCSLADMYAALKSQLLTYETLRYFEQTITCDPQMTLYSSVFTSPARVRQTSGLDCTSETYQHAAGKHADIATLATAHEMGMEYT
jgi:hypothetical protein